MSRSVLKTIEGRWESEGQGVTVRRTIGLPELKHLDPFLLLDDFCVKKPAGFPNHPHRGFETVTYMLKGAMKHRDFVGNEGVIGVGDIQWMTAGKGVIHSEMPGSDDDNVGLQLWINLRRSEKMDPPGYQDINHKDIPVVQSDGVTVKVIAGEALGAKSKVHTKTPTTYLDFEVKLGAKFSQPIPSGWTAFAYILHGQLHFGEGDDQKLCKAHHAIIFSDGDRVDFNNKNEENCHFVLIAGQPLGEPIVQKGPFVMTSDEEIQQTLKDYELKINGFEAAANYK